MAETPKHIEVTVTPAPVAHAGEIPADLRPYIEAPEDTKLAEFPQRYVLSSDAEVPQYSHVADAIRFQGRTFVPRDEPGSDMLHSVFDGQRQFQALLGHDPKTTEELADYIKNQVLALLDEGHEALAEVSWKPWAKDSFVNKPQLGGELADILCFLVNLAMAAGLTAEEFYALWREKAMRNIARQQKAGGYSVQEGKCPTCRRAIDDLKAKNISTGQFGGVDFCDQPECITAYRTEKGI